MGLLTEGEALDWPHTKVYADFIRRKGIEQFIYVHNHLKTRSRDQLLWGDEIEYILLKHDKVNKKTSLYLNGTKILQELSKEENEQIASGSDNFLECLWRPEYAEYMVEGLPGRPFGHHLAHFNLVEDNMRKRRAILKAALPPDCYPVTMSVFPRLGCKRFTTDYEKPNPVDGASCSLFFPDNTPQPFIENLKQYLPEEAELARKCAFQSLPDTVYLDAMGFGMGCCCLQVTFQAWCLEEARELYDQLAPFCPIMMALSAASPIIRGYLLDTDCRWKIISDLTDDRTAEERGLNPLKNDRYLIAKSRYDSISTYLTEKGLSYSDLSLPIDQEAYSRMRYEGIDHCLARHIAHLFIRDPIAVYQEKVETDSEEGDTDHFENIQSTNWQSLRFKPPPSNSSIGWRVEFRSMELQLTDFENAAFVVFIVLLTRTILTFKLNTLIPLSCVDENMRRGLKRDAARSQKFYFRRGDLLFTDKTPVSAAALCSEIRERKHKSPSDTDSKLGPIPEGHGCQEDASSNCSRVRTDCPMKPQVAPFDSFSEMSINEIINGSVSR
ncbi:hypothetical protein Ciccas_008903 [Cichlidogyrus casuarinus]|uniref:Glutamate--cysteine ligase n=1 Tax=Cichlidogyrus casuarinus TaxID=1844966 RepID=A0ABD2Q1B2_9PLAT